MVSPFGLTREGACHNPTLRSGLSPAGLTGLEGLGTRGTWLELAALPCVHAAFHNREQLRNLSLARGIPAALARLLVHAVAGR